jgi:predicted TIM-barrel fold metal-dependent hydrolase
MREGIKVIDALVNLNPPQGWLADPSRPLLRDRESLDEIRGGTSYLVPDIVERRREGATPEHIVELMDQVGIDKGVLTIHSSNLGTGLQAIEQHPGRFVGALSIDPRRGMEELRKLKGMVRDYGIKAAKVTALITQKTYDDRIYYPFYAKCVELDIPITANVGIPGPRVPGEVQNPIYLDEVCWFFPELKVIMTHGGQPWQFTCVKLMLKWPNLYYMTSSFTPRRYPREIMYYANTRGADKVMFASGYPSIPFEWCLNQIKDLPLRDHVWSKFLKENAIKVFKF